VSDNPRIEELRRRVERDPASIAFAQLAEECRRAGQFQESVEICRVGLAIHPGYLSARVTLGRALIELDRPDEAQVELEHVLKSAPENLAALRGLGQINHARGNLSGALLHYRAALNLARNDPDLQETVNDLSLKVEPPAPQASADGLSLEQMTREMFEQHPPGAPVVPVPAERDAAVPRPFIVEAVVVEPVIVEPLVDSQVSRAAAPVVDPLAVSQPAAHGAKPPDILQAAAADAELHDIPLPAEDESAGHEDESGDQPAATIDLGTLEEWVDAEPAALIAEPQVAEPQVAETQVAEPHVAELHVAELHVAELHVAPEVAGHEPDAPSAAALDPLESDMIAWLDAAPATPAGIAERTALAGHAPDVQPDAALGALPTDMIAWLDAAPFVIPEIPLTAAHVAQPEAHVAEPAVVVAEPAMAVAEPTASAGTAGPSTTAGPEPEAHAAATHDLVSTNTIPWLTATPLVVPYVPRPAALAAEPAGTDDETDIQSGATPDPLALRTIGALEKWLDAIHVSRTHLGA
jgi:hypothetical protein